MNAEPDEYIPCSEAARLIRSPRGRKTHTNTIVRFVLSGKVRGRKEGRFWWVHRGDVLAMRQPRPVVVRGGRAAALEVAETDAWVRETLKRFNLEQYVK